MVRRCLGFSALLFVSLLLAAPRAKGALATLLVEDFRSPESFYQEWKIKKWAGSVTLRFSKDASMPFLDLRAPSSSWAFVRRVDVDLKERPLLTWAWKADVLPKGSDGRRSETDDEAAQLYVFFPGKGLLGSLENRIIGYTWEQVPQDGTMYTSPKNSNTKVFVLRSGKDGLGVWKQECRDVAADFAKAFSEPAPKPIAVCFQIDSDDTRSTAQSSIADLAFRGK
jgi:hypothetical protein